MLKLITLVLFICSSSVFTVQSIPIGQYHQMLLLGQPVFSQLAFISFRPLTASGTTYLEIMTVVAVVLTAKTFR